MLHGALIAERVKLSDIQSDPMPSYFSTTFRYTFPTFPRTLRILRPLGDHFFTPVTLGNKYKLPSLLLPSFLQFSAPAQAQTCRFFHYSERNHTK